MITRIHPQARTTPKIRQEIKASGLSDREAAKVFNITRATAAKWLKRDDVQDRSHRAHTLHTTLSAGQEAIVLSLRQTLYLPLDDLLYITRQYINADVSRSGIARLLKREGMARLEDVIPAAEGETIKAKKTFKDYEPGFLHVDIKYLPQMPDETSRRYLFVAIDRATRWVFLHVYGDMSERSSVDFLRLLKLASPIKISKILTDNGSQFTDRFTTREKKPSGQHAFDKVCAGMGIEHRLAPPRHPQTNGMVERFNGRISELLQQTRFDSRADLETTLLNYLKLYNHHIPQRAIGAKTPIQALKEWQQTRPELFVKRVYDQTGLDTYQRADRPLKPYSSNFDFTATSAPGATKLFKIHGTIEKDVADGHSSRMILTDLDYDATQEFREALYDRLKSDIDPGTSVLIVGQSLADEDLREVVQRAILINQKAMMAGRITLLLYTKDENRAKLFELRGIRVAFGGLDDMFAALSKKTSALSPAKFSTDNPLDFVTNLRPVTTDVNDEVDPSRANVSAMFSGWPAKYADITRGLTFDREIANDISQYFLGNKKLCAILLGASGVGKTSAARQAVLRLRKEGFLAFEHKQDHSISSDELLALALRLKQKGQNGVLFIDEAHSHLFELNNLIDSLVLGECFALRLIIVSTRNHWGPRIKTPNMYAHGREFPLSRLSSKEINLLMGVVENVPELRALVEEGFGGFSVHERRRRLVERCEADMFVCLKNIFASEKFDDIILREFGTLSSDSQEVYRWVSAMENSGIKVHRQLVMRILNIDPNSVSGTLSNLAEIIHEYDVDTREGIYGWKVRHHVIAGIIAKYKFHDIEKVIDMFGKVINSISPTFDIEILTIRQLCNIESGISRIPDRSVQNNLLRRMMSIAPGERVPRHRLIRNLIELGEFEKAESEIRIFEKDFGKDGSVVRYRISLMIARASVENGLPLEDRIVILEQARELAVGAVARFESNKYVLTTYCDLGVETLKLTGRYDVIDDAMSAMKKAESRLGDPDITKKLIYFQRRIAAQISSDTYETNAAATNMSEK